RVSAAEPSTVRYCQNESPSTRTVTRGSRAALRALREDEGVVNMSCPSIYVATTRDIWMRPFASSVETAVCECCCRKSSTSERFIIPPYASHLYTDTVLESVGEPSRSSHLRAIT